jgi:hypothetical protein
VIPSGHVQEPVPLNVYVILADAIGVYLTIITPEPPDPELTEPAL